MTLRQLATAFLAAVLAIIVVDGLVQCAKPTPACECQ